MHECGWWENVQCIDGQICFCFCHDNLGYALTDGDRFVISDWPSVKATYLDGFYSCLDDWDVCCKCLQRANVLDIDNIHGRPPNYITYDAHRDDVFLMSDDTTGQLRPSQILSIQAFAKFRRPYNMYIKRLQVYRKTALGQFVTMQSKRYFQRCSKSLWTLRDVTAMTMVVKLLEARRRAAGLNTMGMQVLWSI